MNRSCQEVTRDKSCWDARVVAIKSKCTINVWILGYLKSLTSFSFSNDVKTRLLGSCDLKMLLRPFMGQNDDIFHMHEYLYLHIVLCSTGFNFPVVCKYCRQHWPSWKRVVRGIIYLKNGRKLSDPFHCWQPSCKFQRVAAFHLPIHVLCV